MSLIKKIKNKITVSYQTNCIYRFCTYNPKDFQTRNHEILLLTGGIFFVQKKPF